eukprot:TRINITY_DN28797_c0_g1_i1.p1 TRINITY_DN28797_c0_g1~~TRINITY_DN28797_c0_g1_i1.p1  ORF type:complete len:574 (-),score=56.24 TRINITY_DN28797_c0_g1_i1:43-1764(-)
MYSLRRCFRLPERFGFCGASDMSSLGGNSWQDGYAGIRSARHDKDVAARCKSPHGTGICIEVAPRQGRGVCSPSVSSRKDDTAALLFAVDTGSNRRSCGLYNTHVNVDHACRRSPGSVSRRCSRPRSARDDLLIRRQRSDPANLSSPRRKAALERRTPSALHDEPGNRCRQLTHGASIDSLGSCVEQLAGCDGEAGCVTSRCSGMRYRLELNDSSEDVHASTLVIPPIDIETLVLKPARNLRSTRVFPETQDLRQDQSDRNADIGTDLCEAMDAMTRPLSSSSTKKDVAPSSSTHSSDASTQASHQVDAQATECLATSSPRSTSARSSVMRSPPSAPRSLPRPGVSFGSTAEDGAASLSCSFRPPIRESHASSSSASEVKPFAKRDDMNDCISSVPVASESAEKQQTSRSPAPEPLKISTHQLTCGGEHCSPPVTAFPKLPVLPLDGVEQYSARTTSPFPWQIYSGRAAPFSSAPTSATSESTVGSPSLLLNGLPSVMIIPAPVRSRSEVRASSAATEGVSRQRVPITPLNPWWGVCPPARGSKACSNRQLSTPLARSSSVCFSLQMSGKRSS